MRRVLSFGTLLLASVLAGCSDDGSGPIFCTEEYRAGITVEITDSATGLAAAEGATLTIREGEYVESWTDSFGGLTLAGAWERAGTYDVTVAKDGYHTWIRTGVVVDADECHVHSVALGAALVPITSVVVHGAGVLHAGADGDQSCQSRDPLLASRIFGTGDRITTARDAQHERHEADCRPRPVQHVSQASNPFGSPNTSREMSRTGYGHWQSQVHRAGCRGGAGPSSR